MCVLSIKWWLGLSRVERMHSKQHLWKILCRGQMLREHVKSKRGNTVGKYFADPQLTIGIARIGSGGRGATIIMSSTPLFSLSHDDHTDLQSTHLMMMM